MKILERIFVLLELIINRLFDKGLSGRFILTMAVAYILLAACLRDAANVKEFKEIILVVIYAYFNKANVDNNKQ